MSDQPKEKAEKIRIDKWLWHARIVKTRTLAQKLVAGGNVRVESERVTQTAYKVGPPQVLTIIVADNVKILRILSTGARRGPAPEAAMLYEDLSPPKKPKHLDMKNRPNAIREQGAGRPTKKQRRELDQYRQSWEQ